MGGVVKAIGGAISPLGMALGKKVFEKPKGPNALEAATFGTDPDKVQKIGQIQGAERFISRAGGREQMADKRSQFATGATQGLISDLQKQSRGEGPSLAEAQLKQAQDRTLAQQLAAVQAGRGGNAALTARQAMRTAAQTQQETAQAAAQARIQEQLNAQQLLAQTANQEAQLADSLAQKYLAMGFDMSRAQQQALLDMENFKQTERTGVRQADAANAQASAQKEAALLGAIGSVGAALATPKSDKKLKKNVKSADKDVDDFLSALSAKGFKYKNTKIPGTTKGQNYGILAQDLEKSKMGKSLVEDSPDGKGVNMQKGFGAVLAAQARMNQRVQELEKLLGKQKKEKKRG